MTPDAESVHTHHMTTTQSTYEASETFASIATVFGTTKAHTMIITLGTPIAFADEMRVMYLERKANEAYNHARRNGYTADDMARYEDARDLLLIAQG